jgi:hypothetical protein
MRVNGNYIEDIPTHAPWEVWLNGKAIAVHFFDIKLRVDEVYEILITKYNYDPRIQAWCAWNSDESTCCCGLDIHPLRIKDACHMKDCEYKKINKRLKEQCDLN